MASKAADTSVHSGGLSTSAIPRRTVHPSADKADILAPRSWRRGRTRGQNRLGGDVELGLSAVFKVLATHCEPYYTMPWSTSPQTTSSASACALMISGKRFLVTNAHAVHHASLVELQRPGEDTKHIAQVVCRGPDCDLALLDVEDGAFWDQVEPIPLCRSIPSLNDRVRVCGYPVGGDNASITEGVVSRVDMQPYRHGLLSLLALQIDAAINPGNSGGPTLDTKHRCVGVAFQSLRDGETENIGYVIPAEVIEQFVAGYQQHSKYVGFGHHGFAWQPLDNNALREALGASNGGILVKRVDPTSPASKILKERDVLLSIGGHAIGSGGTVQFRRRERIAFPYITSRLSPGDMVPTEVLRDGIVQCQELELTWPRILVPVHPVQPPAYLIFGGLVFVPLSEPYLRSEWGELFEERAPIHLIEPWFKNMHHVPEEEVVVLSSVLASPLTAGLTHFMNRRLLKFNGVRVLNLTHLAEMLDSSTEKWITLLLDEEDIIALPRCEATELTAKVMQANLIPTARCLHTSLESCGT